MWSRGGRLEKRFCNGRHHFCNGFCGSGGGDIRLGEAYTYLVSPQWLDLSQPRVGSEQLCQFEHHPRRDVSVRGKEGIDQSGHCLAVRWRLEEGVHGRLFGGEGRGTGGLKVANGSAPQLNRHRSKDARIVAHSVKKIENEFVNIFHFKNRVDACTDSLLRFRDCERE